jgi:hypothetical protein
VNRVQVNDICRQTPTEWNELTKKQLLAISMLFLEGCTLFEFKSKALVAILGIKRKLFRQIHPEDAHGLCQTFNFLFKEVTLTRNLIPSIRIGVRKYYGPSDALKNFTFVEFTMVHSLYESYQENKDELILDEMMAILYRKKKWFWSIRKYYSDSEDPRIRFRTRSLTKRKDIMSKAKPEVKYSVFLLLTGVLNSFPRLFPNVYRQVDDGSQENNNWISLIISLADGKTDDKSLETIMNSNLYNVFLGLDKKSREYFEFLEKRDRHD